MLKKIVAISGKPGLYKVLSQGKNMLIVESLTDGKRLPAHSSEKVVSLGDISMFTETEDKPLHEILEALKTLENGAKASIDPKSDNDTLRKYFAKVVPDFDRDRVYPTDIRKLLQWYNLLIESGITDFKPEEKQDEAADETPAAVAEVATVAAAESAPDATAGTAESAPATATPAATATAKKPTKTPAKSSR
jgi:hypothetical protein